MRCTDETNSCGFDLGGLIVNLSGLEKLHEKVFFVHLISPSFSVCQGNKTAKITFKFIEVCFLTTLLCNFSQLITPKFPVVVKVGHANGGYGKV